MKDLDYYLNLPYKIEITKIPSDEGGGYCAMMPDFKDVAVFYGDGETKSEALNELENVFKINLETMLEQGYLIPEPNDESKKIRVNVSLSQKVLNAIDKVSSNRSAFLEKAALKALSL